MTDAQRCHRNGWTVGTRLRKTERLGEWQEVETILITKIGESFVLARCVGFNGVAVTGRLMERWLGGGGWRRV